MIIVPLSGGLRCFRAALRLVEALCRSRIFNEQIRRSAGTTYKIAAAIRANEIQFFFDAIAAKRAFKSADHRLRRINRQISITAFAIRF